MQHVCVCVLLGGGGGGGSSWGREQSSYLAVVVVETAVYLTGYSDCLTGFYEPLSPPYRCHAGLKMSSTITDCVTSLVAM